VSYATTVSRTPRRHVGWGLLAAALYLIAVVLTWLGSADPPIDLRSSAYWYRTLSRVPGLLDICGDFTWGARLVPPILAGLGGLAAVIPRPRSRVSVVLGVVGFGLAAVLLYATTQHAIPWGQRGCIIN
jgi:hypothetical protein